MKHNLVLGVIFSLVGAFLYSSQVALIKAQAPSLPALPVVIFIQSAMALLFMLPILFKNGFSKAKKVMQTDKIGLHLVRALASLSISYLLFYAVTLVSLVNAMLLANTAPLIAPFISYIFLKQKINHRLWIPIVIGFMGMMVVLRPDSHIFQPASLLAIGSAVCLASSMLCVRKLSETDSSETTTFYFLLLSTLISGIIALYFWEPITLHMMLIMLGLGGLYFSTQYLSAYALRYANVQLVATLFYSNIIYSALISFIFWSTLPSWFTFFGMIMITLGGVLCIQIEYKQKRRQLDQLRLQYGS